MPEVSRHMKNYNNPYSKSDVITVDGDQYLMQGDTDDEIVMFRDVDDLLECERDPVNLMMYDEVLEE